MLPQHDEITNIINIALAEDIGPGDITSNITIPDGVKTKFCIRAREEILVCGTTIAAQVFAMVANNNGVSITTEIKIPDGKMAQPGDILISGYGDAKSIMAAERTALNLLRQMCGVATITKQFVDAIKDSKAKLLDTRKTIPGLRALQKYAVTIAGGYNHRFGLYDGILIKDNHIAICGGVENALKAARANAPENFKIEIECDTIIQVKEALNFGADIILLDNMNITELNDAVKTVAGRAATEASGSVNLQSIKKIAATGVDFISVGSITNNPANIDIGLDME